MNTSICAVFRVQSCLLNRTQLLRLGLATKGWGSLVWLSPAETLFIILIININVIIIIINAVIIIIINVIIIIMNVVFIIIIVITVINELWDSCPGNSYPSPSPELYL